MIFAPFGSLVPNLEVRSVGPKPGEAGCLAPKTVSARKQETWLGWERKREYALAEGRTSVHPEPHRDFEGRAGETQHQLSITEAEKERGFAPVAGE